MKPKEDPKDKADRLRQRRIAEVDRMETAQGTARSLTTDLGSVYDLRAISMFGASGSKGRTPKPSPAKPIFGTGR